MLSKERSSSSVIWSPDPRGRSTVIVTAIAESYDESNCKLVLSYEDDSGKEYTVEQPFTMTVTAEMEPADMEMMMDVPEETGSPIGIIIAVIAGLVVIGAVTAVLLLKRRRRIRSSRRKRRS